MRAAAGQVYACGKNRFRRVEQVRRPDPGALPYALVRVCGPKGKTHAHPVLGETPITVQLAGDGSMPAGYTLLKEDS